MLLKLKLKGESRYIDSVDDATYISPLSDEWDDYIKEWESYNILGEAEKVEYPNGILIYYRGSEKKVVYLYGDEELIIS